LATDESVSETPATDSAPRPSAPPDESSSLADHEQRFGPNARQEPHESPAETPTAEPTEETAPSGDQPAEIEEERDEKGRFLPRKRHRAASQVASPEDSPRIRELTRKWREAESERDALRDALRARSGGDGLTPAAAARPAPPPPLPADDPEPQPGGYDDYSKFVAENARWHARQELRAWEQQRQAAEQQRQAEQERQRLTKSWTERVAAAKQKYSDYAEVALESDTPIPQGSLIDAWILEHEAGAEMLYHFQRHPDEVHDLLQLPVLKQAESLALLAQRFNGHGRPPAAATGSAAASNQSPPPKPPNPVRTGPVRAGDEPPDPEKSSLADHEKWWPGRARRGGGSARA
jgi:hypothetical protein